MKIYNFDIDKLVVQYIPIILRKPKNIAWLKVIFTPAKYLLGKFIEYITYAKREIKQNGQVIRLETLLNDLYDKELRRITITDTSNAYFVLSNVSATIITNDTRIGSINQPIVLKNESDFNYSVDFVVKIFGGGSNKAVSLSNISPTTISNTNAIIFGNSSDTPIETLVRNTLNKYKIAGKKYAIQNI